MKKWFRKIQKGTSSFYLALPKRWAVRNNIEKGSYAVSVYHDENNNDILETAGLFGVPIEPYGFSNNPSMTFGPSFKKSVFKMTSDKDISIKLK
mgnify:CR=1 FL=1